MLLRQSSPQNFQSSHAHSRSMLHFYPCGDSTQILVSNLKLEHINCIVQKNPELGGLYLGDIICTMKYEILRQNQIEAVVSCVGQESVHSGFAIQNISIKVVPAHDTMDYPISVHFQECFSFIEEMRRQRKNVLLHCHAGISRSVTILCAYLIMKQNYTPQQALALIRSKRKRAKPNANFWNQLVELYQNLQRRLISRDSIKQIRTSCGRSDSQLKARESSINRSEEFRPWQSKEGSLKQQSRKSSLKRSDSSFYGSPSSQILKKSNKKNVSFKQLKTKLTLSKLLKQPIEREDNNCSSNCVSVTNNTKVAWNSKGSGYEREIFEKEIEADDSGVKSPKLKEQRHSTSEARRPSSFRKLEIDNFFRTHPGVPPSKPRTVEIRNSNIIVPQYSHFSTVVLSPFQAKVLCQRPFEAIHRIN